MEVRFIEKQHISAVFSLWREAFPNEDEFWDAFSDGVFKTENCIALFSGEKLLSALYFFTAFHGGRSFAYIFAVATDKAVRGRGLASLLLRKSHSFLSLKGFSGALLCPQNDKLFDFYRKIGYNSVLYNDCFETAAAKNFGEDFSVLSPEEFLSCRNAVLPKDGIRHTEDAVSLFSTYGRFAKCSDALFAYHLDGGRLICDELLGNRERAAELVRFEGVKTGFFKTLGDRRPYCLALSFDGEALPAYFGLELM